MKTNTNITLEQLKKEISKFVKKRDWEQYHSPKNLSMSISIEAAELMEKFQWLSVEESKKLIKEAKKKKEIEDELADIGIYLIDFCNLFDINLGKIIRAKLAKNNKKYPITKIKGKAKKYTEI